MSRSHHLTILLLLAVMAAIPVVALAAETALVGIVRDAETSAPLAGAVISLPDLARTTITDAGGRYILARVPPGPRHITIRRIGYAPRSLHALVPREGELEINVSLPPEPLPVEAQNVRAPIFVRGADTGESAEYPDRESSIAAVRHHPLLAEPDVFPALGGGEVVLEAETPHALHVRGGEAGETAYSLDGIPVLNPYHTTGMSSAFNPDALSSLSIASTAPALARAHALSAAVDAVTRTPGPRLRAQGSLSTTQGRVTVDGPLGTGGAGYVLSLRSGLHDLIAPAGEPSYVESQAVDWLAKLETPVFGGRLRVLGYDNGNEIGASGAAAAETEAGADSPRNDIEWHSQSLGAEWRREYSRVALLMRGYHAAGEASAVWATAKAGLALSSTRRDAGFFAALEHSSPQATSAGELRVETITTSYRVGSDSDAVPSFGLEVLTPVVTLAGRHIRHLAPRTEATFSLSLATTGAEWRAAPGTEIRWAPSTRTTLSARYARAHQFAQSLRNAESVVGNVFPAELYIGTAAPGVPIAASDLGVLAAEYRPRAGVRLGLQAYARRARGLLLAAPESSAPFATGEFAVGSGSAQGIAVDLAASGVRYGVVASYGLQRVRLTSEDGSYVPSHGAVHRLEGGVTVFPTSTLSFRVGAEAAFGRRTTIASGSLEWEACNLLDLGCEFAGNPELDGGSLGAAALPAYSRVDFGVRKHWHLTAGGRDAEVALFGTVTNLLGRRNTLTYLRDPETGEVAAIEMRPLAPLVLGIDWRF